MENKLEARAAEKKRNARSVRLKKVSEVMYGCPVVLEFVLVVRNGGDDINVS